MEDIIDIIVTETTNLITITSSGSDEVIDVNIIDNREDIVLNVTPTVVEININSLVGNFGVNWGQIGGTLTNQTDLNTALGLKADLVGGKVPSSQLPSYVDDVVEVANYAALPATGETGKIYVTIDTNYIYRWTGSVYVEIKDSSAVWGAITGTLSNQTDLQNALNAKFDDPIGDATQYIDGSGALQTFPVLASADKLILVVRNTSGATITKGTVVYINGANGNKPTIAKALATGDATSAQTLGLVQTNIANNSNGNVVLVGSVIDLDTSAFTEGQQLYLSGVTAGAYTATKTLAPTHLVYVGVIARAHPTLGVIEVKIQNGYELYELHDVSITSVANNDGLFYEASTDLWKNKSIATVLGYTPQAQLNGTGFVKASGTTISYDNSIYVKGSGTATYLASWSATANTLTTSAISYDGSITSVEAQGLSSLNGLDVQGNYGGVANAPKIRSYDATTSSAFIDFQSTGGRMYIGINKSTANGMMTGASAYATVLTTGLGTTNLEFGTNLTKRLTLDGTTGAATFTSTISANGATLTGALSGTSAMFSGEILNSGGQLAFSGSGGQPSTGVGIRYNGTFYIYPGANGFNVRNSSNTVNNLFVADSGAATFSSSVTASGGFGAGISSISSWGSSIVAPIIEGLAGNCVANYNAGGTTPEMYLVSNGYYDGTNWVKKVASGSAQLVLSGVNQNFVFQRSATAAAGSTISWTPLVFINAATGNVGIGTTAPSSILDIRQNNLPRITLVKNSVISWYIGNPAQSTSNNFSIGTDSGGNTNILNITNTGNVGIGTTAPLNPLTVSSTIGYGAEFYRNNNLDSRINITNTTTGSGGDKGLMLGEIGTEAYVYNYANGVLIFGTNATERMRITSGGVVLVNQTTLSAAGAGNKMQVATDFLATGAFAGLFFENRTGGVTINSNWYGWYATGGTIFLFNGAANISSINSSTGVYTPLSDRNKKKDFEVSNIGLNEVMKLKPTLYRMKSDSSEGLKELGFIAQDVKSVIPNAYVESKEFIGLNYNPIVAALTKAVQELKQKIDILENK